MSFSPLLPDRHPQMNFFTADIFDNLPFKDDTASMEHPIYSLSTKTNLRVLIYENNGFSIEISPSHLYGLPTIFDKDVMLYCGSLLMEQINKGIIPSRTIRFSPHDLLVSTNRQTDGDGYERLKKALKRLKGVSIVTNIKTNKRQQSSGFGLVDDYHIEKNNRNKKRMIYLEVTLSKWFYNSLISKEVLTINRKYFQLRKPLERRLYELARKHCGTQTEFKIGIAKLKKKTGSTSPLKKFRFYLRKIIETNHLPDYQLYLADNDVVHFSHTPDDNIKEMSLIDETLPTIRPETINKAREMTRNAGTGWDFYGLQAQFAKQLQNGFRPKTVDGAFTNFIKMKIKKCP